MAYRAEILHRTSAAVHFVLGLVAAVVMAIVDLDVIGVVFALIFAPVFYVIGVSFTGKSAPAPPASGTRLASERATLRRALLVHSAIGLVYAVLLAVSLVSGDSFWILPGILLGTGAAQATLARRVREDEAREPGTLRALPGAFGGQRAPQRWRSEWGDVAP